MDSLRNFLSGPAGILVILLLGLPFVFLGTGSLGTGFTGSFGSINGEDVTETDVSLASSSAVQRFQSIYGEDFDFNLLDEDFKNQSIRQELILQKVLLAEARSLGFINESTRNETKKEIVQSPIFQIDGIFDEGVYEAQVNSNGFTKEGYIDVMTDFTASDLYRGSLNTVSFVTQKELQTLAELFEKSSDLNFIKINFTGLEEAITNTSSELLDYYNENEILFYSDEKRSFEYITLLQSDYTESVQVPSDYLTNSYNQYLTNFENSAQIRISHIMIEKINYDSREDALSSIKNIQNLLIEGNEFSSIAKDYSEDIVTKDIGGDLEYFEKDIFPPQFDEALTNLELNEITDIVELDETFHILKVTEKTYQEPMSEDEIKENLLNELIETESFALMQDDLNEIEKLIIENTSLYDISEVLNKKINSTDLYSTQTYEFDLTDPEIRDYLFSSEANIGEPYAIELSDRVIIMSVNMIKEPELQNYDSVEDEVNKKLSNIKAIEKVSLLSNELNLIENLDDKQKFIDTYAYVTKESFVGVKRYSSLMPREILTEVFNSKSGSEITATASNGDKYIINITKFNSPDDSEIEDILNEYTSFSENVLMTKMSQIINEDVFDKARVNLSNLSL
jgi:parvulin-like peptidyl-prolyl isomerase